MQPWGVFKSGICSVLFVLGLVQGEGLASGNAESALENTGSYEQLNVITQGFYGGLDQYSFLMVPFVNAGVGSFLGGKEGAALGFAIGVVDELLIYMGVENAYHLSAAFLGAGALDRLDLPYHANHIVGGLGGAFIASGQLSELGNHADGPIQGAVNGYVYAGAPGAAMGGVSGVLDEVLGAMHITQGHYLSNAALSLAQAKALGVAAGMIAFFPKIGDTYASYVRNHPMPRGSVETVAAVLFAFSLYNQEHSSSDEDERVGNTKAPSEIIEAFEGTLSQIIDPSLLDKLMQRQTVIMVAMPLLSSQLGIQLQKYSQDFATQLAEFRAIESETGKRFFEAVGFFTIFVIPYIGEYFVSNLLNDYQGRTLALEAQDALSSG